MSALSGLKNLQITLAPVYGTISTETIGLGVVRSVWRDDRGKIIRHEDNHYVCLGFDKCFTCGREI